MTLGFKLTITLMVVVVSLSLLNRFFEWMNQASDLRLYSGLLCVLSLLVAVPALLSSIWTAGRGRRM